MNICYKYQENFLHDDTIRQELFYLAESAAHHAPQFSAGGCYSIDKSKIFTLYTVITYYVVVIIKFNYRSI